MTDDEIRVSGVASTTNPLGGLYGTSFDGVQAYFDMINKQGGIYGRKLVMVKRHDDQLGQNAREVEAILDQDNVFAVLPVATIAIFSGAQKLDDAKIPTFGWGINDEWAGPPNFFGHLGALCNGGDCPGIGVPVAGEASWASTTYRRARRTTCPPRPPASTASRPRSRSTGSRPRRRSSTQTSALSFGVTDLSTDVKKMVDKGVDFVTTCMDSNGVLTLAKEMRQQGLDALQYLPNGYDQEFMKKNGGFFQGSVVISQVAPIETKPRFPALKKYVKWMKKQDKPLTENAEIGWVNADNFVTGLKMAGPDVHPAEGGRQAQHAHRLRRGRDARSDRLDEAAHRQVLPALVHGVPEGRRLEVRSRCGGSPGSRSSAGRTPTPRTASRRSSRRPASSAPDAARGRPTERNP